MATGGLAIALTLCGCAGWAGVGTDTERRAAAIATTDPTGQTEATRAIAMPFLHELFARGDVAGAYTAFAAPDMIQHNPAIGDGLAAHRDHFAKLAREVGDPASWENVTNMILVDRELFAVHHIAYTGPDDPGRVFVDIWRVAEGRIVEHWDVVMPVPPVIAHDNGLGCGEGGDFASARAMGDTVARPVCGLPDPAASRESSLATLADYSAALMAGDVRAAVERFFTEDYRQHSPVIADGKQGAVDFLLEEFGKGRDRMPRMGPMRVIAEGDLVLMHRLTDYADGSRTANVDIFRVRDGRISEHWDLKQDVPDRSANDNGMW